MGAESKIEWTDHTFNPWWGCQRVSPGCEHCYAETFAKRVGLKVWGPSSSSERRFFGDKHWREPLKWNAAAEREGRRARVFCASMADVFEERADLVDHRARLFRLIEATTRLDWLLLTKRPENIRRLAAECSWGNVWPENVWIGTTCEDQARANARIPHLLQVPAAVRFVSYEPALGPVDFTSITSSLGPNGEEYFDALSCDVDAVDDVRFGGAVVDWIIVGGESGGKARPFDLEWARSVIEQGRAAGTAVFVKQLGARPTGDWSDVEQWPEKLAHKGDKIDEWPEDLRVREWPR